MHFDLIVAMIQFPDCHQGDFTTKIKDIMSNFFLTDNLVD
jgi:hypothetical protein